MAIVSQQGRKASGAEHALLQFVHRLPSDVEPVWFFLEDGEFADAIRRQFASVTVVKMSDRVANAQRSGLPLAAIADSLSVTARLASALKRAKPDLVLTNSMKAHIVGSIAARAAGLRCINYIHDIVEGKARMLLRLVSRLCAVERMTCSKLTKQYVALPRTTAVYAAIEIAQFAQLPERQNARRALGLPLGDVPVVALVGRIARWKGQDRFIRIAERVLSRCDAHFCIVGSPIFGCDAEYVESLSADVTRLNIAAHVTFVPWQDTMENVYAAVDLACNTSTREPFGRTSLEALASGVPVVCFDDAGICEIFDGTPGATSVPAGDEAAFADAIVRALETSAQRPDVRGGARAIAGRMDISTAYADFAATLERVTGRRIGTATLADPAPAATSKELPQDDQCLVG